MTHSTVAHKCAFSLARHPSHKKQAALASALALATLAPAAQAFNEYPAPVQVSFSEMGRAVAVHGDLIFVGADTYGNDTRGSNSGDDYIGAAYLYQRGNSQPARSYFGDKTYGNFGLATAMNQTWLAASSTNPPEIHLIGSYWGYFGTSFTQEFALPGPNSARPSLDMSSLFLVVGVRGETNSAGQVLVYPYNYGNARWIENPVQLIPNGGVNDERYGESVAIDGNKIIVGSPGEGGMGAVYIFERNSQGNWNEVYRGTPRYSAGGGTYGADVDISGNSAIVSDPTASATDGYVHFLGSGQSGWQTRNYIWSVNPNSVALSGNKAALGYSLENYVGTYQSNNGYNWTKMGGFEPDDDIRLGGGVALYGDFLAMGAPSYSQGVYDFTGALFTANIWESYGGFEF